MFSDIIIFPALFATYLSTNLGLRSLGINNKAVLFTFMFIFSHLLFTALNYFQTSGLTCKYPEDKAEYSAFGAILTAIVVVLGYILLGLTSVFRYVFYPLLFLPLASIWIDHLIVSIPATCTHMLTRYIISNLIGCDV